MEQCCLRLGTEFKGQSGGRQPPKPGLMWGRGTALTSNQRTGLQQWACVAVPTSSRGSPGQTNVHSNSVPTAYSQRTLHLSLIMDRAA